MTFLERKDLLSRAKILLRQLGRDDDLSGKTDDELIDLVVEMEEEINDFI